MDNHSILIHKFKPIPDMPSLDLFPISVTPRCGYQENELSEWHGGNCKRTINQGCKHPDDHSKRPSNSHSPSQ